MTQIIPFLTGFTLTQLFLYLAFRKPMTRGKLIIITTCCLIGITALIGYDKHHYGKVYLLDHKLSIERTILNDLGIEDGAKLTLDNVYCLAERGSK